MRAGSGTAGEGAAGTRWRRLHVGAVALVGLAASSVCALCVSSTQTAGARRLLGSWWTWTEAAAPWQREPRSFVAGGLVVSVSVLVLSCAWLTGTLLLMRDRLSGPWAAGVAALFAAPFALLPPALSQDAYAYLAQGAVAGSAGGSPYRPPSVVLHAASPLLQAVDPLYRARSAPYGPLALRLFEACLHLAGGQGVIALIWLRGLVVLSVAICAVCAYHLADVEHRWVAVWLVAGSPLVALHLVGGLHVDAFLAALVAVALLLHAKGFTACGAALSVAAAEVKVTALVVLAGLLLNSWTRAGWRVLGRDLAAALSAGLLLTGLLQPAPFGWIAGLPATLTVWNPISLPSVVGMAWAEVSGTSPLASQGLLRAVFLVMGLLLAAVACFTHRGRAPAATVGLLLATVTLTGPVIWPWYFVPGAMCLFMAGRWGVVVGTALSVGAALSGLPMPTVQMQRVSVVSALSVLAVCVAVLLRWMRSDRKSSPRPSLTA
ncbi:MAG: alpha,6-mannosyltransferase [Actinomycetota bacterium]|nr:alpha,6-mannosyltransferase [Actinomycetota bacterium]